MSLCLHPISNKITPLENREYEGAQKFFPQTSKNCGFDSTKISMSRSKPLMELWSLIWTHKVGHFRLA